MPLPIDRRRFLQRTTTGLSAAVGASLVGSGLATAIEPIGRTGQPKFKFSLAAYSYRKLLTGQAPELTLDDFVRDCARMQLDGTELTSYYFPQQPSVEFLTSLKGLCFKLGLDVSGTAVGNDFCHPDREARQQQINDVKRWVDYAAILGAPVIRIFSGSARSPQTTDEAHQLAVSAIEECCAYSGERGVYLALENHGGLTTTVDGMLRLVRDVQSPWFGVNLDTGNFHGEDVYADITQLAPYALNVQVKVVVKPEGGSKEPTDFDRLASIMNTAGYRGYIVLEYEESEDPRVACPRYVDAIREAFA